MKQEKKQNIFFELLKAGLWEKEVHFSASDEFDLSEIFQLAEEQTVVGLVAAGLEKMTDANIPKQDIFAFVVRTMQLEQRNIAMNSFVAMLVEKMRARDINTLLVKGQGIAQCYERPLWRTCGDIDLFLDRENYYKAKDFLIPLATSVEQENEVRMHLGMVIQSWVVELHGTLHEPLLGRIDRVLDEVQEDTFKNNNIRIWKNGSIDIYLPHPNNDVIFVFTHILQHYFSTGIGLRQICDWCRLLWTYHKDIDAELLKNRLQSMKIMTEWQVFCAYAVDYLGAPKEIMPLFTASKQLTRKAKLLNCVILSRGNFGQGRDLTYYQTHPYVKRKAISFKYRVTDAARNFLIFPEDAVSTFLKTLTRGCRSVIKGK